MKKISTLIAAAFLTTLSATAFACPKGTTLVGGSGPNHKGGKCLAISGATTSKAAKPETTKAKENTTKVTDNAVKSKNEVIKATKEVKTPSSTTEAKVQEAKKATKTIKEDTKEKAIKNTSSN